jgi:TRAP-type C4-dicarboxylate transport system permease small subunit
MCFFRLLSGSTKSRAGFVWLVFLGAAVGLKRGSHFGLHLCVAMLPRSVRGLAAVISSIIICNFAAVLVVQGLAFLELGRHQQLPVIGISKVCIYAAMPVGGLLMLAYSLPQFGAPSASSASDCSNQLAASHFAAAGGAGRLLGRYGWSLSLIVD